MEEWHSLVIALSVAFIAFTNLILLLGFITFFTAVRSLMKKGEHLLEHAEEKKRELANTCPTCAHECEARQDCVGRVAAVMEWAILGYALLKRFKKRR